MSNLNTIRHANYEFYIKSSLQFLPFTIALVVCVIVVCFLIVLVLFLFVCFYVSTQSSDSQHCASLLLFSCSLHFLFKIFSTVIKRKRGKRKARAIKDTQHPTPQNPGRSWGADNSRTKESPITPVAIINNKRETRSIS